MGRLIVSEFITIDGVIEAPGGEPTHPHTGWTQPYFGEEEGQYKFDEVIEADSLLLGRTTYESFAGAWPTYEGPFADKMNSMPKYVVTSTLSEPLEWTNSTVLSGGVVEAVTRLKDSTDGVILDAGSGSLSKTLVDEGLVDELRLMVFPVVVGGGLRMFSDERRKQSYTSVDTRTFDSGIVVSTYRSADEPAHDDG